VAVDDPSTIDIISEDSKTKTLFLTISDHLDWDDTRAHQLVLQTKLNAYLRFLESGEVFKHRPDAAGKRLVIRVVARCEPSPEGRLFIEKARTAVESAGFSLEHKLFGS
jgi:hypothetical protein